MNVLELYDFSKWFGEHGADARVQYQALAGVLNHNATQPQKQPVKEPLDNLKKTLLATPLEQLTNEQTALLGHLEVSDLLGAEGVMFVQDTVEMGEYDPATAASEITAAQNSMNAALELMGAIGTAFGQLKFLNEVDEVEKDRVSIRVQFKDKASISDVAQWKLWSNEWHDIVRGVGLCIDEAPEDTHVVGATNGSIIMVLSGTLTFVTLLALITKGLASIVKEGLVITEAIEDLRHKKILNKQVESELRKQQEEITKNGVKSMVQEAKAALPKAIDGEKEVALTKAVEKFLKFNKLGGDVDFVPPPVVSTDEEAEGLTPKEISAIRQMVEEIRSTKAEVKLLANYLDDEKE